MSDIALAGAAKFRITGSTVEIDLAGIVNHNPGVTSGTLMVKVWAHPRPYTGGAPGGHEIASFKIAPLPAGARVSAIRNNVPYRAPPFGSYHTTLTIEEYDSSAREPWVVVDALTFSGSDRFGRALTLQGFNCSAANGAVNVEVARVLNDRQADASNALRLKCWATRTGSGSAAGARYVLGDAPLTPLAPGRSHDGVRVSFTYKEVPPAQYHIALVLEERDDDQWQPRDHALSSTALHLEEQPDKPESRFGQDLVQEAQAGRLKRPSFRDDETDALKRVLAKAGRNAACLIGEPGVGKTAVVEGLACAIAAGEVPESLKGARILDVNLSFLGAGASMRGEFEARVKELVEMARTDRKTILFLDELHTVRSANNDASQMLKSDLGRGRISCIGATTTSEWRLLEADPALARRFQVVQVKELAPAQATEILRQLKAQFEQHHDVTVPAALLAQVVDLTVRYLRDGRLPDKAIDILDEACAHAALNSVDGRDVQVTLEDLCDVLALRTGLPAESLRAGGLDLADSATLLAKLETAILGQDAILRDTVRALARRARLGARPGDTRPLWSALFAGPSGVGKTQLAKELARNVFGDPEQHLIYINLADFRDEYTVSRLVGAPPGYVGYGQGGELTNALRRIATGVLLLDEIEKAHPKCSRRCSSDCSVKASSRT